MEQYGIDSSAYDKDSLLHYLSMTTDWAISLNEAMQITNCYKNPAYDLGQAPGALVGKAFAEVLPESSREKIYGLLRNCRLQRGITFQFSFVNDDSHYINMSAISFWQGDQFVGYKVLLFNRTYHTNRGWVQANQWDSPLMEQSEPEEASYWKTQAKQYELLAAVSLEFSGNRPFDQKVNHVLRLVGTYLDADRCVIAGINYEEDYQCCLYEWHSKFTHSPLMTKKNKDFVKDNEFYRMLLTAPYVCVADTTRMPEHLLSQFVIEDEKAFIHFPIFIDGILFGSFGVDYCRRPHDWTPSELEIFQTIVNCLAAAIQKHQTEESLLQSNLLLEEAIQNYPGLIWHCDLGYRCTLAGGASMDLLGLERASFMGKSLVEVFEEIDFPEIAGLLKDTFRNGRRRTHISRNKRHFSILTSLIKNTRGEATGLIGTCLDTTDLQEMQERLSLAVGEKEQANQAMSDFISRISHEMRPPLNAITGMCTIGRSSQELARTQYCLDRISTAAGQMLQIINDVLDMAKIEANKFELSPAEFDFEAMLQKVCDIIGMQTSAKKQHFFIDFHQTFTYKIVADELRLTQVLINLLNNAVKFTPEGGTIILTVRECDAGSHQSRFHFSVSDNGIGISEDQQNRLFYAYEQAERTTSHKYGGTGLGLAICQNIVLLMGGAISLESQLGKGSSFSFTIPLQWSGTPLPSPPPFSKEARLLLIDNDNHFATNCKRVFETGGITCHTATSSGSALRMLDAAANDNHAYSLVLLSCPAARDEASATLRSIVSHVSPDKLIVIIPAAAWEEVDQVLSEQGISQLLTKPLLPASLLHAVSGRLQGSGSLAEHRHRVPSIPDFTGKRLLLVEDIDINQEIIISMLEDTGIAIDCAPDGLSAIEIFTKNAAAYDIILMDIQMPVMDGLEATRQIRKTPLPNASSIPIIAMTANAFIKDIDDCYAAGMNDHLPKPVNLDKLFARLSAALFP